MSKFQKPLDLINVIDLEATCVEDRHADKGLATVVDPVFEIIEIGICVLDTRSGNRIVKVSYPVIPQKSEVTTFCTSITGWTMEELQKVGRTYPDALEMFRKDNDTKSRIWASWGDYDRSMFERNGALYGTNYPFGKRHINIKELFALACGLKDSCGLGKAMEILDIPFEGKPHRGADDAWNTAAILNRILEVLRKEFKPLVP